MWRRRREPVTYRIGGDDPTPIPVPREPTHWGTRLLATVVVIAFAGFLILAGYVVVHPTARERQTQKVERQGREIVQLQREVRELTLRVDSLSLRLDETPTATVP